MAPTIVSAAGVDPPGYMRGKPLHELRSGKAGDWPEEVFLQISESHCGRAIRTRRWKYSVRAPVKTGQDPDSDVYVEDFLYDLDRDPHERRNLVEDPDYVAVRRDLAEILIRRMEQAGERAPEIRVK
jgi:arylsulfatase A-like enzyme